MGTIDKRTGPIWPSFTPTNAHVRLVLTENRAPPSELLVHECGWAQEWVPRSRVDPGTTFQNFCTKQLALFFPPSLGFGEKKLFSSQFNIRWYFKPSFEFLKLPLNCLLTGVDSLMTKCLFTAGLRSNFYCSCPLFSLLLGSFTKKKKKSLFCCF